ncbi:MAG: dihydrolipoyl dehydrogenase [Bacteroidaceae bacterium]|nr:dihydrolipoyl dehydrogenase [Bacteroidaceae bacterium]MBP5731511.1 dihydrolipoyl dehydrogenase [Bacteroidaceae bacterium]
MQQVDLIIIGAGPGGYETAVKAAHAGLKTVIAEMDKVGGTCLNVGCIPTKCFCKNAELLSELSEAELLGIKSLSCDGIDMKKVVERKNEVVNTLVSGIEMLLKHPNIIRANGKARFVDAKTIEVTANEQYTAPNIIIATGSVTKFLPIPGKDLPKVLTSTEMLDITEIPKRLAVIGGGVIGMEFASIFNAFGSEVTVLEYCKEILPNFDADIAKRLKASLKGKGINIINNAAVNGIKDEGDHYSVTYMLKEKEESVDADIVLMAVGRGANTASLNLEDVGIQTDRRGIVTDDDFRTSVEGIYAIGDVNGKCQLAHAASFQGQHVLNVILGKKDNIRLDIMPAAVFTNPEAATVGLTAEYCKENGINAKAHKAFFRANGKALAMNESDGMVKILTDEDDCIIGCHMYGPHSADLIQEIAALMNKGAKLSELADIVHAHPTLGEVILNAAHA